LREYISQIPSSKISQYIEKCLAIAFNKGGMVLQDLANELGRRLEYTVTNGLYQGTVKTVGFDGLWISPEGHSILVEVKTTDAYRISLDTIIGYRNRLSTSGQIVGPVSCLIVVGREDTGELEAQVRGSRHAWDIRLISADALIKLVQLKENTEDTETGLKIRSLLVPMEYTRLDKMIDVMFTAAKDVEAATVNADSSSHPDSDELTLAPTAQKKEKGVWEFTNSALLQKKRDQIVAAFGQHAGVSFIKKSRAMFWDAGHSNRFACTISKRYTKTSSQLYWFAFHPQWREFLSEGKNASLALGCMDLPFAFAIPFPIISSALGGLNTTTREDGELYWHIQVIESKHGEYAMLLPKKSEMMELDSFRVTLSD
jgi:hypothetical protein